MPSRSQIHYFGSGPARLPTTVIEAAAAALVNYADTGLGLAEHSHRGAPALAVVDAAKRDIATFLRLPEDEWDVLFMQSGGHGQFASVVYNVAAAWLARRARRAAAHPPFELDEEKLRREVDAIRLDYAVTGRWSDKAAKEAARLLGADKVNVVVDSRSSGSQWRTIPDAAAWRVSPQPVMSYYCDNETADGVEFPAVPAAFARDKDSPDAAVVVADMSSNILTRELDWDRLDLVFFGAQKNLGITGVTVVLVRKKVLADGASPDEALMRRLGLPVGPSIMSYETIRKNNSLYNTLPIFDVFVAGLTVKRLLAEFPDTLVTGAQARTDARAALIYGTAEANPHRYAVVPDRACRSRTNICLRVVGDDGVPDEDAERAFIAGAEERGLQGVKGYRAVGGLRFGNFFGVEEEGIRLLVGWMEEFAKKKNDTLSG